MRAREIITEGMTFEPTVEQTYVDDQGRTRIIYTGEPWWSREMKNCRGCGGAGKEVHDNKEYSCHWCKGTGKSEEVVSSAPSISVSNSTGMLLQKIMGIQSPDYGGVLRGEDLAAVARRLIKLKNTDIDAWTREPEVSRGAMRHQGSEGNVSRIGGGPTIVDFGMNQQVLEDYIDRLLELIHFAQKNNAQLSWA